MNEINYTSEFELLLKNESEKCECYSILHRNASTYFYKLSISINIPVIILSSVVGFFNTINFNFGPQYIILGGISIFTALLKTIDSYFSFAKRSENHRLVALSYEKISKNIQLQLALPEHNRIKATELYNNIRNSLESIREGEPDIPDIIIQHFKSEYKNYNTCKPSICNGLTDVKINNTHIQPVENLHDHDILNDIIIPIPVSSDTEEHVNLEQL